MANGFLARWFDYETSGLRLFSSSSHIVIWRLTSVKLTLTSWRPIHTFGHDQSLVILYSRPSECQKPTVRANDIDLFMSKIQPTNPTTISHID